MSEPIPESIPTSADRRSQRPLKKRALTPASQQSAHLDALFAHPDRDISIPTGPLARPAAAAPPEIVANVQGSSAGAGSGEFHVYKASRRREYERLRLMDEEVERERRDREFEERRIALREQDEEKLGKNQARRAKMKARKEKAEALRKAGKEQGMDVDGNEGRDGSAAHNGPPVKKKLGPAKVSLPQTGVEAVADGENGDAGTEERGITFHDDD